MSWQKNTSTFSFFLQTFLLQCTKWNLIGWCEAAGNCIILPLNFQQRKLSRCVSVQSRRLMQRLQTRDVWRNPQSWVFITKKTLPSLPYFTSVTSFHRKLHPRCTSEFASSWSLKQSLYWAQKAFLHFIHNYKRLHVVAVTGVCVCTQNAFVDVKSWLCGMKPQTKLIKITKMSIK